MNLRRIVLLAVLTAACRDHGTNKPPAPTAEPPRSAARLAPEAGVEWSSEIIVPLFGRDVEPLALPLSLSLEAQGDTSMVLLPRGTRLPTATGEVLSTATANRSSIDVHVRIGDEARASLNRSVVNFRIVDIPPAPRGVPRYEVTFVITDGTLYVSAMELPSKRRQPLEIVSVLAARLDAAAIAKLLAAGT